MASDEPFLDGGDHLGRRNAFFHRQIDFIQALAVENLHGARCRDIGRIVKIDAEKLALGFEHTDDAKLVGTDA
ncbi:MAG: hypothetical protein BWY57_02965 [Betaproteobacteria bacterium ADurb.Bin341]|nr:MAG: hypothetical protein BWY57_02965 [Betaproteobacteria bacterium ADurb.Bin341]